MTWRLLTVGLVAACIGLPTWLYHRDRESPASPSAERLQAQFDARRVATALGHGDRCPTCDVELLARTSPRHWLLALSGPAATRCFELALDDFAFSPRAGLAGVRARTCPPTRN